MKCCLLATLTAFLVLAIPLAGAIQPPDVTFIPDKISANSSFLMIADPHAGSSESVSVRWVVFGIENGFGSIPRSGNMFVCYFSSTDPQNTCGPNIFTLPSMGVPYEMQVNASNQYGQTESTMLNVTVGNIPIRTEISITGKNLYIKAWAGGPITGTISYKVYDSDTLDVIKTGTLTPDDRIFGYSSNITLEYGEYYIAFTATGPSDFGGGVARVTVGGTSGNQTTGVSYDNIVYSPVINPGQKFKIETFKITNIGTDNLTDLSISVAPEISPYLSITPKQTSLEPNESTYLTVELQNIQSSMNISTFANLKSGSTQLAQIPVNLMVSVMNPQNVSSCVGKDDKTLCLGGMCCGEACRVGADCCSGSDCPSGQDCSPSFKCAASVTPDECTGKTDMDNCTGGICCSGSCKPGGDCCSDSDCSYGKTCSYNTCTTPQTNECTGKADGTKCSSGYCCNGECQQCCTSSECAGAGEMCSSGYCVSSGNGSNGGGSTGPDIITIALIGGGVAAAAFAGFFLFKRFKKKGKEGDEEIDQGGEEGEEEFSDEDFY